MGDDEKNQYRQPESEYGALPVDNNDDGCVSEANNADDKDNVTVISQVKSFLKSYKPELALIVLVLYVITLAIATFIEILEH